MRPSFWNDLKKSYKMLDIAFYFAWSDTKARYRRSFLGPFWIVIATLIGVVGLGFVWSVVFKQAFEILVPSITLGMVFWYFMSGCIVEAPGIFITNASIIKGYPNPYLFFVFKHVIKHLILLAHNLLIVVAVCFYFRVFTSALDYGIFLLGLCMVCVNLFWIATVLALVGVRFRDIELVLSSVMPIFFFLTPVIFKPEQVASIAKIMYLNPFSSLIRVLRDPLYTGLASYTPLLASFLMVVLGLIITPLVYRKISQKIPYLV